MSPRAEVTGFKKCSRDHIDKSVYDFVHHVDSDRSWKARALDRWQQ